MTTLPNQENTIIKKLDNSYFRYVLQKPVDKLAEIYKGKKVD